MSSDSESSSPEDVNSENEDAITAQEKQNIRQKISSLSFEDLLKLKEEIGSKIYNETVFGTNSNKAKKRKQDFKRANKNRPREMSSKIRVKANSINPIIPAKKVAARDPRFDPLCGSFDDKTFKSNYKFLKDVREKEKKQLEEELRKCNDADERKKIKYLIQRIENQVREQEKQEANKNKLLEEKNDIRDKLKRGEKPIFKKKSVKKLESLIEKYEELKKTNKLQKYIEKKTKKLSTRERRKLNN